MADDASFVLGFLVGIMIIIGPQLFLYIRALKKQIAFFNPSSNKEEKEAYPNRKERT